jgi:hypothetical protein
MQVLRKGNQTAMTPDLRETLTELVAHKPQIPLWSHSANMWFYNGEQFGNGKLADHRWLQDLSRWADDVEAALRVPETKLPPAMHNGQFSAAERDRLIASMDALAALVEKWPHELSHIGFAGRGAQTDHVHSSDCRRCQVEAWIEEARQAPLTVEQVLEAYQGIEWDEQETDGPHVGRNKGWAELTDRLNAMLELKAAQPAAVAPVIGVPGLGTPPASDCICCHGSDELHDLIGSMDATVARAVEHAKRQARYDARLEEAKWWRTYWHENDCVDGINPGHGGSVQSCDCCGDANARIAEIEAGRTKPR